MAKSPPHLPGLMEGGRKAAFLVLLGISIGEVMAQVAASAALKSVLVGFSSGWLAAISLLATGTLAASLAWLRSVQGERFGLSYVNDLRLSLARQAVMVASAGGPGRFGTMAIRMTGDLTALKDWASKGICGGLAGALGLIGGVTSAWIAAGPAGLVTALTGPVLAALLFPAIYGMITQQIRRRRQSRGRLSARIGDLLLNAPALAPFGAERRGIRPLDVAGKDVLETATRELAWSSLLHLPALMTLPAGAAVAVILDLHGLSPTDGIAGWAALLFALSLTSLALNLLASAIAQVAERAIAMDRLRELMQQASAARPAAPSGSNRLPAGPALALELDGQTLVEAGAVASMTRSAAEPFIAALVSGGDGVSVSGLPAANVTRIDWARRIGYVGHRRPLPRGRIEQVLAAKRHADPRSIETALKVAGLPDSLQADTRILDPRSPEISPDLIMRLQLVRALSHRPRALILDDPALLVDQHMMQRVRAHCANAQITLLIITNDETPHPIA